MNLLKDRNMVIPMYLLKNYRKFHLELNEFIFFMYLYNQGDRFAFDPNHFSEDLDLSLEEVMNLIGILTEKKFLSVEVSKNEKGIMEEVVLLEPFYQQLKLFMMDEINQKNTEEIENSSVYEMIEKEFGRTLSSIEYEIIKAWLENHMSEDLIKEAVKEAVLNGVSNLKYIDKILYEWGKKGIKTVQDVEAHRKKRNAAMEKNKESDENIDLGIMDWDWFDEDE